MHVSIRTLRSQDVLTVQIDDKETVGAFKKRSAACLPYDGNCKLMLRVGRGPMQAQFLDKPVSAANMNTVGVVYRAWQFTKAAHLSPCKCCHMNFW